MLNHAVGRVERGVDPNTPESEPPFNLPAIVANRSNILELVSRLRGRDGWENDALDQVARPLVEVADPGVAVGPGVEISA